MARPWPGGVKIAAILATALLAGTLYFALARPVQVLPLLDPVVPFTMVDHRGQVYRSHRRAGPVVAYAVGATRDAAGMGLTLRLLDGLQRELAARGWWDRVEVAFVTVDPEHDGPDVLRALAETFPGAAQPNVSLLTGSPVTVRLAVGAGFGIYFEPPVMTGDGFRFGHEPALVLVDGQGVVRARYRVRRVGAARVTRDIGLLLREADAKGVSRAIYRAAHLFLCYPR